jgi:signal transduction histidine kinase
MEKRAGVQWGVFVLSGVTHLAALVLLRTHPETYGVEQDFVLQFTVLTAVSAFGAVVHLLPQAGAVRTLTLGAKVLIYLVLCFPLLSNLDVPIVLGVAVVIELCVASAFPLNVVLAAGFTAIVAVVRLFALHWDADYSFAYVGEQVLYPVVILGTVATIMVLLNHYRGRVREQSTQIQRLDNAVQQLSDANLGFQRYADTVAEQSTIDERNRITREIHDTTIYALTNLRMMVEAAQYLAGNRSEKLQDLLKRAHEQSMEGIENTRLALRELRAVSARKIGNFEAIQRIAEAFQTATGVAVRIEYGNLPRFFGNGLDRFIYRFIQEGMTNAFRHGMATSIRVLFWVQDRTLSVTIHDNGRGANNLQEGIGLRGMRERVNEFSGTFKAANVADGFELIARIPIPQEQGEQSGAQPPATTPAAERRGTWNSKASALS